MATFQAIGEMEPRLLLEEKRCLEAMIGPMAASVNRGADWLIQQFAPRGPIMKVRDLSYCHKVTWGLHEAGRHDAAKALLDWVAANASMAPGRLYFPEEPPFNKDMQLLYSGLTLGRVAEALEHAGLTDSGTREAILAHQHTSGGVYGNIDDPEQMASINPLVTSFFTEWALAAGLEGPARRSGDFLADMVGRNEPHMGSEPGRFYFNWDPSAGDLVTDVEPGGEINTFVDTTKPKQHFYQIGTAMAALADVHLATGEDAYLDAAMSLASFEERLNPGGLRWPSYCKIGWGAAELYRITGLPAHRRMAANVSQVTFMDSQTDAGGWSTMYYPLVDRGAWEGVVYDGSGAGKAPRDDGSWVALSGYEITGEFIAEMGRTLSVFREALYEVNGRLASLHLATR